MKEQQKYRRSVVLEEDPAFQELKSKLFSVTNDLDTFKTKLEKKNKKSPRSNLKINNNNKLL
ncbi:MAG: hypothetical protein R3361_06715, partial [Aequorivita vladivostokensis]|nr:hypothetical protein [Aequorivita vladivostokensis]